MENRWSLDEKFQFETNGCKNDEVLIYKQSFLPYDENRWFLDEKFQVETTDVKTMNLWSLNTRFYHTI